MDLHSMNIMPNGWMAPASSFGMDVSGEGSREEKEL